MKRESEHSNPNGDGPAFRSVSFSSSKSLVDFGEFVDLTWSVEGSPDTLSMDGVSVLNLSTQTAQPARRHTFVLEGRKGSVVERRTVTVAARGIDGGLIPG